MVLILMLQRCDEKPVAPVIIRDTTYKEVHDTTPGEIVYVGGEIDTLWFTKPEYKPDTNYTKLLQQYLALGKLFFKTNAFENTYKIEYGTITVYDTTKENMLAGTRLTSDLKIPEIVNTIEAPPRRQFYIGGALQGNTKDLINGAQIGGLYKDKKDRIYGIHAGYDLKAQQINYSMSRYWKINLRRK